MSKNILWNVAIVVALVAIVALYINDRQLAGALAISDQHNQEQIAKLQRDLAQSAAAAEKSVDALAVTTVVPSWYPVVKLRIPMSPPCGMITNP